MSIIEHFIKPRSIAVDRCIGAASDYGGRLLRNLRDGGFQGAIYPVNPRRPEVQGMRAWPDVADIPEAGRSGGDRRARLRHLATWWNPAASAASTRARSSPPGSASAAPRASSEQRELRGFGARGGGAVHRAEQSGCDERADRIFATASSSAGWGRAELRPSGISVVSQSGALSFNPVPSRAAERGIGLRAIVSVGNQADLTVTDFVEYFVETDEETQGGRAVPGGACRTTKDDGCCRWRVGRGS